MAPVTGAAYSAGGLGRQGTAPLPTDRLREFLPAAAELARQREGAQQTPRQQIDMLRLTLRMGRQVMQPRHSGVGAACCLMASVNQGTGRQASLPVPRP